MKKITQLAICLTIIAFTNCSKDDEITPGVTDPEEVIDSEVVDLENITDNTIEEETIELSTLEDGISIDGATIEEGILTPNEQTSFSVAQTEQSGFQDVGFEIELNVPENYAGAYLQLLNEDGSPSENYFDIPKYDYSSKNLNNETSNGFFSNNKSSLSAKSLMDETTTIDVDFDDTIPPGSFCYFLCIYDDNGNISAPQTLCVEVEDWGGNDALDGSWTFTKLTATEYGETYTQNAGEERCDNDDYPQSCFDDTGNIISEIEIDDCNTLISLVLNLNSNGSQSYTYAEDDLRFDYELFSDECIENYNLIHSEVTVTGNWAYDEEEQKLTIVDYTYDETETVDGEIYDDGYDGDYEEEIGVGFDLYITRLTANELVMEFRDTDIEYGTNIETEYKIVYYFTK